MLTVTQMLRERGVVGKFVEFFGPGLPNLPLADRATIGNMSPEYGATCGIFPVDAETLRYLEFSGRPPERVELVEAYCRSRGCSTTRTPRRPTYSDTLELDLGDVEPCLAGPEAPAGPRRARRCRQGLPCRAAPSYVGDERARRLRRGVGRVLPGERPAHRQRRRRGRRSAGHEHAETRPAAVADAPRRASTTARS